MEVYNEMLPMSTYYQKYMFFGEISKLVVPGEPSYLGGDLGTTCPTAVKTMDIPDKKF